ncbi:Uncharacterised protein [Klebsiella pneumoniae]|nr:Uncharacterised protein [Klebsiella pneumoniae]
MNNLTSTLGWIDFSSAERDRINSVIDSLNEPGTLDELGIGQVRDGFANLLFPGFSTIQTRAKYLVTLPRLLHEYLDLRESSGRCPPAEPWLQERENQLAQALVANSQKQGLHITGIIGSANLDSGVARRPSSVYWNALRQLGIINTSASLARFYRELDAHGAKSGSAGYDDEDDRQPSLRQRIQRNGIPDADWAENATITLQPQEAEFLRNKFLHGRHPDSVMTQIFQLRLESDAQKCQNFSTLVGYLTAQPALSERCRYLLTQAEAFSVALEGRICAITCCYKMILIAAGIRILPRGVNRLPGLTCFRTTRQSAGLAACPRGLITLPAILSRSGVN